MKSFTIPLGEWKAFDPEVQTRVVAGKRERRQYRRGIVAPVRTQAGKLIGAIVVAPDGSRFTWISAVPGRVVSGTAIRFPRRRGDD